MLSCGGRLSSAAGNALLPPEGSRQTFTRDETPGRIDGLPGTDRMHPPRPCGTQSARRAIVRISPKSSGPEAGPTREDCVRLCFRDATTGKPVIVQTPASNTMKWAVGWNDSDNRSSSTRPMSECWLMNFTDGCRKGASCQRGRKGICTCGLPEKVRVDACNLREDASAILQDQSRQSPSQNHRARRRWTCGDLRGSGTRRFRHVPPVADSIPTSLMILRAEDKVKLKYSAADPEHIE